MGESESESTWRTRPQRLYELVNSVLAKSENPIEDARFLEKAIHTLEGLKFTSVKMGSKRSIYAPEEYICLISNDIMMDPVTISSGLTFDRKSIQNWMEVKGNKCPKTGRPITNTLTQNRIIKNIISQWCSIHTSFQIPTRTQDLHVDQYSNQDRDELTEADGQILVNLLEKLSSSSSLSDQREAAFELRSLTKDKESALRFFGESETYITQLINPLLQGKIDPNVEESLITTVSNIVLRQCDIAITPSVISALTHGFKSVSIQTRVLAVATVCSLSFLNSNRIIIFESGALTPLLDILMEGHDSTLVSSIRKDTVTTICNLFLIDEIMDRAVLDGVTEVLFPKLLASDKVRAEGLSSVLSLLSRSEQAAKEMRDFGAVSFLMPLMYEHNNPEVNENCLVILHNIFSFSPATTQELAEILTSEPVVPTLARDGPPRAKELAKAILAMLCH